MRFSPPTKGRVRPPLYTLPQEDSFRARRRAIRHHRHLTQTAMLALNAAWALGLLTLGTVVLAMLLGLLHGQ